MKNFKNYVLILVSILVSFQVTASNTETNGQNTPTNLREVVRILNQLQAYNYFGTSQSTINGAINYELSGTNHNTNSLSREIAASHRGRRNLHQMIERHNLLVDENSKLKKQLQKEIEKNKAKETTIDVLARNVQAQDIKNQKLETEKKKIVSKNNRFECQVGHFIADHRKAVYGTILGAAAVYGIYKGYTTKDSYINTLLKPAVTALKPTITSAQNFLSNIDWQPVKLYSFVAVAIGLPRAIGKKVDNNNTNPIAAE